ncbi:MAG: carboxypeptidase regulatory-like domain-containing protein [Candidatus Zambryskibacteria bacterium]|nr:carboxypeptidase regulatory-like domain-containing protein [Candidatus Zambryskibacteria bacterium]
MKIRNLKLKNNRGFTLVEVIVAACIFAIVAGAIFQGFTAVTSLMSASRDKLAAINLVNSEFELVRNLSYADVGIQGSIPDGVLLATSTIVSDGREFIVNRTIRNIDDPFDGTIGGVPDDLSPADYKMVQISVNCINCKNSLSFSAVSNVSPKNLETASNNGALLIKVFDANGNPVPQAQIQVENTSLGININDTTNNNGFLIIVDVPPDLNAYRIIATKPGFTTDRTYPSTVANPNPIKPDATVLQGQLTSISFIIDKVSTINVYSRNLQCIPVSNIEFNIAGSKLIGTSPDILKFEGNYTTGASGSKVLNNIEWDTFNFKIVGGLYLAGTNPASPFSILPDSVQDVDIIISTGTPNTLLVTVTDGTTSLPLSGVKLTLDQGSKIDTRTTGRGYMEQTDWSGGSGQTDFSDPTKYWDDDGNIDAFSPTGELKLKKILGSYVLSGVLSSSIFDTGTSSNFTNIIWNPTSQPPQSGVDSVRFQFATALENTATTTWQYLGPDGTTGTYYTTSNNNINSVHDGDRYYRYKIYLSTLVTNKTPNIADVAVTYTSGCVPPGQALFINLIEGNHDLLLERTGYQTKTFEVNIITNEEWKSIETNMLPN